MLQWDTDLRAATRQDSGLHARLDSDIGAIVRNYVPLTADSRNRLTKPEEQIVLDNLRISSVIHCFHNPYVFMTVCIVLIILNFLSQHMYNFNGNDKIKTLIKLKADCRFKQWRSTCCTRWYKGDGINNPPPELTSRLSEWQTICASFNTEEKKAMSDKMKAVRALNLSNHRSGRKPFLFRSKELLGKGSLMPILDNWQNVYKGTNHPNMKDVQEKAAKLKATMEVMGAVPNSLNFNIREQVQILDETLTPPRAGTARRGVSSMSIRDRKKREKGSMSTSDDSSDEVIQLRNQVQFLTQLVMQHMMPGLPSVQPQGTFTAQLNGFTNHLNVTNHLSDDGENGLEDGLEDGSEEGFEDGSEEGSEE